jgi:hypothetical protein
MAGISYVFTISRVAEMLGEDEEWFDEISIGLDPEDGRLGVLGLGEESTTAFTRFGIDNLAELVQIYKADSSLLPAPNSASELAAVLSAPATAGRQPVHATKNCRYFFLTQPSKTPADGDVLVG